MKKLVLLLPFIWACETTKPTAPEPCRECTTTHRVDTLQHPGTYFANGYWHLKFSGLGYFQVVGQLDSLHPRYVVNGVPLLQVVYDSDTWYVFDTITMQIPLYSPFTSQYTSPNFNYPLSVGSSIIYITNPNYIINAVGYSFGSSNFVNAMHTYRPRCEVLVFKEMVGDTITVFAKTRYNYDTGIQKVVNDTIKVIVE
jgi:hypothetical protein